VKAKSSETVVQSGSRQSFPGAEKFHLISHFFRRSGGDELQKTARLLAQRIALLPGYVIEPEIIGAVLPACS